jgi:hypothetical protein
MRRVQALAVATAWLVVLGILGQSVLAGGRPTPGRPQRPEPTRDQDRSRT